MIITCMGEAFGPQKSKMNTRLKKAGFTDMFLDFSWFCKEGLLEQKEEGYKRYLADNMRDDFYLPDVPERLLTVLERYHLPKLSADCWTTTITKAPHLMRQTKRSDMVGLIREFTLVSMEISRIAGAKYMIVYPPKRMDNYAKYLAENKAFYCSLIETAKEKNMQILLKNDYDCYSGKAVRGTMADAYELASFIDALNEEAQDEVFGLCMDTGVCNLLGQNMLEFALVLSDRIKAVRISENDGIHDESLMPFGCLGKMDWLNLIRGLRAISFDSVILFDFSDTLNSFSHLLQEKVIELGSVTAKYIVWQLSIENVIKKYSSRVLFGAGNMCRNYMKCYGEEFPPLYTCDNNAKIWGTTFEGFEIKNPEELKKLPQDCAIFICNIYYDEIEKQLREMGITNPIERFNDEYLPSMYTDRFDANKREVRK